MPRPLAGGEDLWDFGFLQTRAEAELLGAAVLAGGVEGSEPEIVFEP